MEIPLTLCRKKAESQLFVFCHKQKTLNLLNQISLPISKSMYYPFLIFRISGTLLPVKQPMCRDRKTDLDHRFGQIIMAALFPPLEKGD
jgi:hypothetical protein